MKNNLPSPRIIWLLVLMMLAVPFRHVQAISGLPGSHTLANSGRLQSESPLAVPALSAAVGMGMDWVFLDVRWATLPVQGEVYDLRALAGVVQQASRLGLHVALSLREPPAWAIQPDGPAPQAVAALVTQLVALEPQSILAVALFPEANTSAGWGAPPSPQAYALMLADVQAALTEHHYATVLVVGGLSPSGEMSDTAFLDALYRHADLPAPLVVGLAYAPFAPDLQALRANDHPIWHYEQLRMVMLQAGRQSDVLWITRLTWQPTGNPAQERIWLKEVYSLLQQQLYIGLVNFDGLVQSGQSPIWSVDDHAALTPYFTLLGEVLSGNTAAPPAPAVSVTPSGGTSAPPQPPYRSQSVWDAFKVIVKTLLHRP
ncbi:MAG: hypothetical protein Fur0018_06270 [Anaerolineales bacterium]